MLKLAIKCVAILALVLTGSGSFAISKNNIFGNNGYALLGVSADSVETVLTIQDSRGWVTINDVIEPFVRCSYGPVCVSSDIVTIIVPELLQDEQSVWQFNNYAVHRRPEPVSIRVLGKDIEGYLFHVLNDGVKITSYLLTETDGIALIQRHYSDGQCADTYLVR